MTDTPDDPDQDMCTCGHPRITHDDGEDTCAAFDYTRGHNTTTGAHANCTCRRFELPVDMINHPPHYRSHPSGIEVIQITEHMGFCLGNVVKYVLRCDHKGDAIEDLKKARFYLDREITRREASEEPAVIVKGNTEKEACEKAVKVTAAHYQNLVREVGWCNRCDKPITAPADLDIRDGRKYHRACDSNLGDEG